MKKIENAKKLIEELIENQNIGENLKLNQELKIDTDILTNEEIRLLLDTNFKDYQVSSITPYIYISLK